MLISPPPWRGFLYIPFSQTFPEEIRDCTSFRGEEVKFSPQGMPFKKTHITLLASISLLVLRWEMQCGKILGSIIKSINLFRKVVLCLISRRLFIKIASENPFLWTGTKDASAESKKKPTRCWIKFRSMTRGFGSGLFVIPNLFRDLGFGFRI